MQHQAPKQTDSAMEQMQLQLMEAIVKGDERAFFLLLQNGVDLEFRLRGDTVAGANYGQVTGAPLVAAAAWGRLVMVKALLTRSLSIESVDNDDCTALIAAAAFNHVDIINYLMLIGVNVRAETKSGYMALTYLAQHQQVNLARRFLRLGARTDHSDNVKRISPLISAAHLNDLAMMKLLLEYKANINAIDVRDETALMHAAREGHKEAVSYLLESGANASMVNDEHATAFLIAYSQGHYEIAQLFLDKGLANVFAYGMGTCALKLAAFGKVPDRLQKLLNYAGQLTLEQIEVLNRIMVEAVEDGKLDSVKMLICAGADVNYCVYSSPLMSTVGMESIERMRPMIQYLLEQGAQIDLNNNMEETALMRLIKNGEENHIIELAKILLLAGANIKTKDYEKKTLLMHCIKRQLSLDVFKFFLNKGADPLAVDRQGDTLIMYAARYFKGEQFKLLAGSLIEAGVNPLQKNLSKKSPIDYLLKKGREADAVELNRWYADHKSKVAITFCGETHFVKRRFSAPVMVNEKRTESMNQSFILAFKQ